MPILRNTEITQEWKEFSISKNTELISFNFVQRDKNTKNNKTKDAKYMQSTVIHTIIRKVFRRE